MDIGRSFPCRSRKQAVGTLTVERAASIAAAEASAAGVRWILPLWSISLAIHDGAYLEAPERTLGSAMARARVRGFQGTDCSAREKVLACAKHWVAYGAAEGGRDYNTTDVSERTLREIYFPPFKAASMPVSGPS